MNPPETRIGVISDTHGLLRPEAVAALCGSQLIVHAGDVGRPEVLEGLRALAPTVAVRGNIDTKEWAASLPATEVVEAGKLLVLAAARHCRARSRPGRCPIRGRDLRPLAQALDRVARRCPLSQPRQRRPSPLQAPSDDRAAARCRAQQFGPRSLSSTSELSRRAAPRWPRARPGPWSRRDRRPGPCRAGRRRPCRRAPRRRP